MRLQVQFRGRVQGVGFRATAIDCARGLELTGFVQNQADGSVLLEAQGSKAEIDRLVEELNHRMGHRISRVEQIEIPDLPDDAPFTIRQ